MGLKETLEPDDAATSQSLPFLEFPCLQSDFTTSESCREEFFNGPVASRGVHTPGVLFHR